MGWRHIETYKLWNGPGTIRDKLINEFRQLPENERNHEELDEIRRNGQKLVWERHKTVDRARQINAGCSA